MEKIKKFNLELALFVKELNSYTEKVNEIDDETTKLLIEMISAVDNLGQQASMKDHESSSAHENQFISGLNEEIFQIRRYIVCCLCHEQIPLTLEDFELHKQKKSHKEKEAELNSSHQIPNGSDTAQAALIQSEDNESCDVPSDQAVKLTTASSVSIMNSNSNRDLAQTNSQETVTGTSTMSNFVKLEDVVKTDEMSKAITAEMIDFVSRTKTRIHNEALILKTLIGHFNVFDSKVQVMPFGSSTYGFGGSSTNFNILANAGGSDRSPITLLNSFEKYLKTSSVQNDFEILDNIAGNRAQKRQLQLRHKKSGVLCWLQFGFDNELVYSSQIIRDYINHGPICYHLIAFFKSLQNALVQQGIDTIHFNTYLISILVIFFLQVNHNFPKPKELSSSQSQRIDVPPKTGKDFLEKTVGEFFNFYGRKYDVAKDLISINIGRFQKRKLDSQQTRHTPEQKSLRDAIDANPGNWENCTMYVEDIKSSAINVAAEIAEKEAHHFKKLCQILATLSYRNTIDEYVSKLLPLQAAGRDTVQVTLNQCKNGTNSDVHPFKAVELKTAGSLNSVSSNSNNQNVARANSLQTVPSVLSNSVKLDDLLNTSSVSVALAAKMIDFVSRTKARIHNEALILNTLIGYLNAFDSKVQLVPFGSSTYGFGGSSTNFNILANAAGSDKSPITLFNAFQKDLKTFSVQNDFEILDIIAGNRAQKRRLQLRHKKSGVLCWLQFGFDCELADSSQIIRDYINHGPICYHLIAYVKSLQNAFAQQGTEIIHFNTYLISILVIFFLQVNHNFPKPNELSSSNSQTIDVPPKIGKDFLKKTVVEFFNFYGKKYEVAKDLISINIGRFQKRILDSQQTRHTPEQKRLRDAIDANPGNWENCTIYVEDIKSSAINVAAEIREKEAYHFKNLCQILTTFSHKSTIDEYVSKLLLLQATGQANGSNLSVNSTKESRKSSQQNLNGCDIVQVALNQFKVIELKSACSLNSVSSNRNQSATRANSLSNQIVTSVLSNLTKLEDVIKTDRVSVAVAAEMIDLVSRTKTRTRNEADIIKIIAPYLKNTESTLKLISFGSSTYGFGGRSTNFNILVNAGGSKQNPAVLQHNFEKVMKTPGAQEEFEIFDSLGSTRVQKKRLQLLHKSSGVLCWVQFSGDFELSQPNQTIRDCINHAPLCYHLIACIRSWQNVLNDVAAEQGKVAFQFNTYIISVLVIFYLQMDHGFPQIKDVALTTSKCINVVPNIERNLLIQAVGGFFKFYANRYETNNQLISVNIERWQEKRLQPHQSIFTPEQKSLRDGIKTNAVNWKNCTMSVQDIKYPGTNVTAEIPEKEVNNFKKLCQVLSTRSHKKIIDEYLSKMRSPQETNRPNLSVNNLTSMGAASSKHNDPATISLESLRSAIKNAENQARDVSPKPSTSRKCENAINALRGISPFRTFAYGSPLQEGKKVSGSTLSLDSAISGKAHSSRANDSTAFSLQNMQTAIVDIENLAKNGITQPSKSKILENVTKTDYLSKLAKAEMMNILSRSEDRTRDEQEIIKNLSYYFFTIDSTAAIAAFGSATYGFFGGSSTNFNILAVSGVKESNFVGLLDRLEVHMFRPKEIRKLTPDALLQKFENSFKNSSRLSSEFELLEKIEANRVQGSQLKILHKKSRIPCILHFGENTRMKSSSQIIHNYMTLSPICKDLIAYVKALINVLNDIATQKGLPSLQFNGYIISVLVIFYLQLKHRFPTINGLQSKLSDKAALLSDRSLNEVIMDFFKFYGHTYESTHLISLNVGRWQEKRLQEGQKNFTPEQKRLRDGIANNPANWTDCVMWVEDIVSPEVNITAEISNEDANNFVKLCQMFSSHVPKLDEEIHVLGSSYYGIRGSNTDFNLLVNTHGERPKEVSQRFFFKLDTSDITRHFKQIVKVSADRVLKRQIHMIHIKTGIQCSILFDSDRTIVESSEIISRYINKEPMYRFLITYIRAWQNVLNELGIAKFKFNTYIISVFALFFLQMNHKLPKVCDFFKSGPSSSSSITSFKMIPKEFFALYGNSYQMWNHVISAHIGRWQERRIQSEQKHFTEIQQRLRKGIEASPENWTNCIMYTQDLVRLDVNITAEISKEAAENFQSLCQTFTKNAPST
ncbi:uncharacterized protein LOC129578676 isoform X2 [Sitodiplosis mosellana]|uniref:uncharacterized protein LOC129578676 isoform X2 n=1 Tax=Sitodiplosis mosellana TaxID=263140 RepID=UPI002444C795|nr:uncharacterized protein LOC129578676 isoform X2 [Sitodiplosis mosellana]